MFQNSSIEHGGHDHEICKISVRYDIVVASCDCHHEHSYAPMEMVMDILFRIFLSPDWVTEHVNGGGFPPLHWSV